MNEEKINIGNIQITHHGINGYSFCRVVHQTYSQLGNFPSVEEGIKEVIRQGLPEGDKEALLVYLEAQPIITEEKKKQLEEFFLGIVGDLETAILPTDQAKKMGWRIDELHELIRCYNTLPEDDRIFHFKKDYGRKGDPWNFHIIIDRIDNKSE